jgi:hypothetical protein
MTRRIASVALLVMGVLITLGAQPRLRDARNCKNGSSFTTPD